MQLSGIQNRCLSGELNTFEANFLFRMYVIRTALERTGGNITQAAKLLCINRTTLVELLAYCAGRRSYSQKTLRACKKIRPAVKSEGAITITRSM